MDPNTVLEDYEQFLAVMFRNSSDIGLPSVSFANWSKNTKKRGSKHHKIHVTVDPENKGFRHTCHTYNWSQKRNKKCTVLLIDSF